ncbi:DgyrCDS8128 [Dimorphilus gyrociliatus]|uniref:DgyrCDS8128 n=1 Tax=Dimorphilus gyrociliatus TaxID=2664684 RepID=A0A7I8VUZ1_9ANNE|nr:DgyrCDS8128 [Dimorphilus gyrociliatus]
MNSACLFDLPLSVQRIGHSCTIVGDIIVIIGGLRGRVRYYFSLDILPSAAHEPVKYLSNGSSLVYCDKRFIACGGLGNEYMNISTLGPDKYSGWLEIQPKYNRKPIERNKHSAWLFKNKFYVWGCFGKRLDSRNSLYCDSNVSSNVSYKDNRELVCFEDQVLAFNFENKIWEKVNTYGNIPCPRAGQAAVLVKNDLFMFGGRSKQRRMNDMHKLNMLTMRWSVLFNDSEKKSKPTGRSFHTLSYFQKSNFLFLYGGLSFEGIPLADEWILKLDSLDWFCISKNACRPRLWHVTLPTLDSMAITIGGVSNNAQNIGLSDYPYPIKEHRFGPSSLYRICFKIVYKGKSQWNLLPQSIKQELHNWFIFDQMSELRIIHGNENLQQIFK